MSQESQEKNQLLNVYAKALEFYEKNKNIVLGAGGGLIALIVAIVYGYFFWLPSQEEKAQKAMFISQFYFDADSFQIALNGQAGLNPNGFKTITKKYKFTKAANLSKLYAGICAMNIGNYDEAVSYLKSYSPNDDILGAQKYGLLADALYEKGKKSEALKYYKKSAEYTTNELIAPLHILKAGLAFEVEGKKEEAIKLYNKIKYEYPRSDEFREIDKYISRLEN